MVWPESKPACEGKLDQVLISQAKQLDLIVGLMETAKKLEARIAQIEDQLGDISTAWKKGPARPRGGG